MDPEREIPLKISFLSSMELKPFLEIYDVTLISDGCFSGGDKFAEEFSSEYKLPIIIHYPNKTKLPTNPTLADFARIKFERNTLIAIDSDILIACMTEDESNGTYDTIKKFEKLKKKRAILVPQINSNNWLKE